MKAGKVIYILAIVLLIVSIGLFLYPSISNNISQNKCDKITDSFEKTTQNIQKGSFEEAKNNGYINDDGYPVDEKGNIIGDYAYVYQVDLDRLLQDSINYNEQLNKRQDISNTFEYPALDLTQYGIWDNVYGYISSNSINLNLPIYLGSSEYNMSYGAVHLANTSLPIGGENTNTVIAGHTGYIGRSFFDEINYLEQNDLVTITTYFDTLNYKVINKKVVCATETNDIYIKKGKDILTLMTCSNRGVDRLIVVCERIF